MHMHWIDYVIIGIVGLSLITGLFRGFVKEVVALGVWIVAIWCAFNYSTQLDPWLQPYIQDKTARNAAAFIAVLLATLIVGGIFNAILSFILRRTGLSGPDRLLGMGFGVVRGIFIVGLIMTVIQMTSLPHNQYRTESQLYVQFDPLVSWLSTFMPDVMKKVKAIDKDGNLIDIAPVS